MNHVAEALESGDSSTLPQLDPLLRKMSMSPEDHEHLRIFLDALNCDDYDKTVPKSAPSGLPVPTRLP